MPAQNGYCSNCNHRSGSACVVRTPQDISLYEHSPGETCELWTEKEPEKEEGSKDRMTNEGRLFVLREARNAANNAEDELKRCLGLCKGLDDPAHCTGTSVFERLYEQEYTELCGELRHTQETVSYCLSVLEGGGAE